MAFSAVVSQKRQFQHLSLFQQVKRMGIVRASLSVSLDGFADTRMDHPLGASVERLHQWLFDAGSWRERHHLSGGDRSIDSQISDEYFANLGAVVMGHGMFRSGEVPWGDSPPFQVPVFVLTHTPQETKVKHGGTIFHFVTNGIESAVQQARDVAGEQDVLIAGGPNVLQQCLQAGLLDELQLNLVPVLLGDGTRLLDGIPPGELDIIRVAESPVVTHLKYRVVKRKAGA
jgi:dihydrofolate reductase